MERLVQAVGRLLSELHAAFPAAVCPGDWAWTTTLVGAIVGLLPMVGAMLVASVRRWTGNRYGVGSVLLFGAIGLTMTAALPLLVFSATSDVFRGALGGQAGSVGLRRADLRTLGTDYCFAPPQAEYLGGARSVREVLGSLSGGQPAVFAGGVLLLVVLPLLAMVFVFGQARLAVRRGPKWPGRLLWLPMLVLMLGTGPLSATVVAHLWLGYLPVAMLGMIGVALVGAPPWSVVNGPSGGGAAMPPAAVAPAPNPSGQRGPGAAAVGGPYGPAGSGPYGSAGAGGGRTTAGPYGPAGGYGTAPYGQRQPQPPGGPSRPPAPYGGQPQRLIPTAPLGRPGTPEPPEVPGMPGMPPTPPWQPARVLAADPGPLPETLQRVIGRGVPSEPPTLPPSRFRRIRPLGSGGV